MILVACGLKREARLLARPGWTVVAGGGDAARLERELEAAAEGASAVLSMGLAGALDPALRAGDVVMGWEAAGIAGALSPWFETLRRVLPHARIGTAAGQDRIAATVAAKTALRAATGASIVDMESHVAARVAARHALPFAFLRAISDRADEGLPPAALVGMNPDGSMALGRVLRSLARRPEQLPALMRTGRSAGAAFKALASASANMFSPT